MNWLCKTTIIGMTMAAVALTLVGLEPSTAFGQKGKGSSPGSKAAPAAPLDPKAQYDASLALAVQGLKTAEINLLQADIKELNLAQFNPAVAQKLTQAVQAVNFAYMLTAQAQAMSASIQPPMGNNGLVQPNGKGVPQPGGKGAPQPGGKGTPQPGGKGAVQPTPTDKKKYK